MDFMSLINKESIILVSAVYGLGMMLKSTKKIPDYMIPFLLLTVSTALSISVNGFNANAVIQAILIVAVAVYSNQLLKQSNEILTLKEEKQEVVKEITPTSTTEFRE
ncbi:MAG: phage holin family protein [Clostridiaceae bacterium]